ncbi:membrane protein [Alteromonas sp. I4]|nr:membrane protein [Alteromonas sp. I4]
MAAANLLALLDDIATMLDDIAVMSKMAAKKTAGVLGDDLALNANQVQGVKPDREIPVVMAVAKGSFINKLILVPAALLISAFVPVLITVLLVIGGLYLCFEGAEKLLHKWFFSHDDEDNAETRLNKLSDSSVDLVAMEKDKIKGAIRTDFILSAEIVVITLGSIQEADLMSQILILSGLSVAFTVGVYGLVAAIVKMDDFGLYLLRKSLTGSFNKAQRLGGRFMLTAAPALMKFLSVAGTIAMFLVGGGILTHSIGFLHHIAEAFIALAPSFSLLLSITFDGIAGVVAGAIIALALQAWTKIRAA